MAAWKTVKSRVVYENKWISLREDDVINPIGKPGIYSVLDLKSESVFVVPVDEQGRIYLIEQYRYPVQRGAWEVAAGHSDGEAIEVAARRELLEETGYKAKTLTAIGRMAFTPGVSSAWLTLFLAEGLEKATDQLDQLDGITQAKSFTPAQIKQMITQGEIFEAPSIASLYCAMDFLAARKSNSKNHDKLEP